MCFHPVPTGWQHCLIPVHQSPLQVSYLTFQQIFQWLWLNFISPELIIIVASECTWISTLGRSYIYIDSFVYRALFVPRVRREIGMIVSNGFAYIDCTSFTRTIFSFSISAKSRHAIWPKNRNCLEYAWHDHGTESANLNPYQETRVDTFLASDWIDFW